MCATAQGLADIQCSLDRCSSVPTRIGLPVVPIPKHRQGGARAIRLAYWERAAAKSFPIGFPGLVLRRAVRTPFHNTRCRCRDDIFVPTAPDIRSMLLDYGGATYASVLKGKGFRSWADDIGTSAFVECPVPASRQTHIRPSNHDVCPYRAASLDHRAVQTCLNSQSTLSISLTFRTISLPDTLHSP